jgi:enoyl-CoA hydratase/carnithine racemase
MAKAQVSRAGDVAELVISAPPLNLFDGQLIIDLEAALDELDALIRARTARGAAPGRGQGVLRRWDVHEFQGWSPGPGWPGRPSW